MRKLEFINSACDRDQEMKSGKMSVELSENSVGGSRSEPLSRRFRRGSRKLTCQLVQVPEQACQMPSLPVVLKPEFCVNNPRRLLMLLSVEHLMLLKLRLLT